MFKFGGSFIYNVNQGQRCGPSRKLNSLLQPDMFFFTYLELFYKNDFKLFFKWRDKRELCQIIYRFHSQINILGEHKIKSLCRYGLFRKEGRPDTG